MSDLNEFVAWVKEKPNTRTCNIDIDSPNRFEKDPQVQFKAWCYDYSLMTGQHVTSVREIDLEATKDAEDRRKYAELQKKFGGA